MVVAHVLAGACLNEPVVSIVGECGCGVEGEAAFLLFVLRLWFLFRVRNPAICTYVTLSGTMTTLFKLSSIGLSVVVPAVVLRSSFSLFCSSSV